MARIDKTMLRKEYSKAWDSDRMIDYCTGKVAAVAVLPSGELLTVDKQSIETRFCFGESGYDYDDAQRMAAVARSSESYFKRENMEPFRSWIRELEDAGRRESYYRLVIYATHYTGQTPDCKLRAFGLERLNNIIDACGGSCFLDELPGKELTVRGQRCRVATAEELALLLEAYKAAASAHEKKVDAYLKRYGTSKVHSWTYWRDA